MKQVAIYFTDGSILTITDRMAINFKTLVNWLKTNENLPFEVLSDQNPTRIIYKNTIKYVELFN